MMENTFWLIAIFAVCTVCVILLCKKAPAIEYEDGDEIDRINSIIASAKHHREQLEARADELVRAHDYRWGSCEADDLARVIFDGEDYQETLVRIMRRKARA